MITCYSLDGEMYSEGISFESLDIIYLALENNWNLLKSMPVEVVINILDEFRKKLHLNKELLKVEGIPFLLFYLKRNNIESLISHSIGDKNSLNEFIHKGNGKYIKAQGRGIACHWIAGNVPTLAFYSIFQALIAKNSNIVRVPKQSIALILELLKLMDNIRVNYKSETYYSKDILKNISLIHFDSDNRLINEQMSVIADARILWGGEAAVKSINSLPKKTTCKDLIFGPKYSFAIFDKSAIESLECEKFMDKFVMDVGVFNQKACSSPQVLFIEKSKISLNEIVEKLSKAFERLDKRYPNILDESTAGEIINMRGLYGLSLDRDLRCSKGLNYTILVNNETTLEEPVGGRCLFVKEIDSVFDIRDLITRRIQTIGIACIDKNKILELADIVTSKGVDRIVNVGLMNIYDHPWDGCFMINELVRWCSINIP